MHVEVCTKSMSLAELNAKRVIESILQGSRMEYQQEQSHGEYDFDLRCPDGTLAAVDALEALNSKQIREAGLVELLAGNVVPQCVENICEELRIQGGSVISSDGLPKIILGYPLYGGAVGACSAIEAAKAECWKDDNRKKLGAANRDARHMAIYVDATRGLAWTALTHFDPPTTTPELPPEITHVWLIGDAGQANKFIVWRASANQAWCKLELVCA